MYVAASGLLCPAHPCLPLAISPPYSCCPHWQSLAELLLEPGWECCAWGSASAVSIGAAPLPSLLCSFPSPWGSVLSGRGLHAELLGKADLLKSICTRCVLWRTVQLRDVVVVFQQQLVCPGSLHFQGKARYGGWFVCGRFCCGAFILHGWVCTHKE